MDDYFTRFGAGLLAAKIESYWKRRGFLGVSVERFEIPDKPDMYGVRSNIRAGYPPRHPALPELTRPIGTAA